jgi:hypothetical protein
LEKPVADSKDRLELTHTFEPGAFGCDDDSKNPLARSLNHLLLDGKPLRALSCCLFQTRDQDFRWLGLLAESKNGAVSFFPGFSEPMMLLETMQAGQRAVENPGFEVDHITVLADRGTYHVTARSVSADVGLSSKKHRRKMKTMDLGQERRRLFHLSVADVSLLRGVKKETIVKAEVDPTHTDWRINQLAALVKEMPFHIINLDPPLQRFTHTFVDFQFILGPKNFSVYRTDPFVYPLEPPYVDRSASSYP